MEQKYPSQNVFLIFFQDKEKPSIKTPFLPIIQDNERNVPG